MNRRRFLQWGLGSSAFALGLLGSIHLLRSRHIGRPNVLLLITDDMGLALGCYGDAQATTPSIDRLAAGGVRFAQAFAVSTCCSPSRAGLLTGLYPHTNGQFGFVETTGLYPHIHTLPSRLRASGYFTGCLGKLHIAATQEQFPFDWWRDPKQVDCRSPQALGNSVDAFLLRADERPFFLMVSIADPHRPYPGQPGRGGPAWCDPHDPDTLHLPPYCLDLPPVRRELALMYDAHSRADASVGAILAALRTAGKVNSTLVVLISDHGPDFPGAKTTMYDPGLHVPLIVRWPGVVSPKQTTDALVSAVDVMPTLLEAIGLPGGESTQGRSFARVLSGQSQAHRASIYAEHTKAYGNRYFPTRVLRTPEFKYIRNLRPDIEFRNVSLEGRLGRVLLRARQTIPHARFLVERMVRHPREELYDLQKDPDEFDNLAAEKSYGGLLVELRAQLKGWMVETCDPWLALWDYDGSTPDPFEPKMTVDGPFRRRWLAPK